MNKERLIKLIESVKYNVKGIDGDLLSDEYGVSFDEIYKDLDEIKEIVNGKWLTNWWYS